MRVLLGRALWAPLALLIVVVDQITKAWAVDALDNGRTIDLFWTLRFNLTYNKGASFGVGQGWGPVIGAIAMVVVVVLLLNLQRGASSRSTAVAVGAIIGGAVGNLIDRLFREPYWLRGGVVDFVDLQWFPIFNVADMAITVGGAGLLLAAWQASRAADSARPTPHGEGDTVG